MVQTLKDQVEALLHTEIHRVTRIYRFKSCTDYAYSSELLIRNKGSQPCYIVPGEMYEKRVLVDFRALDQKGYKLSFVESQYNDMLLLRYIFAKSFLNIDTSSTLTDEAKNNYKQLLLKSFVGPGVQLQNDVMSLLETEFNGKLYEDMLRAMWIPEDEGKTLSQILEEQIHGYISNDEKKVLPNIKVRELFTEFVDFLQRLDNYFFQLISLVEPILPAQHSEIILSTEQFMEERQLRKGKGKSSNVRYDRPLDVQPISPFETNATFHLKIIPPEGVDFDYRQSSTSIDSIIIYPETGGEDQQADPNKFDILHEDSNSIATCEKLLQRLRLGKDSQYDAKSKAKPKVPDVRTHFDRGATTLYFGSVKPSDICHNRNHTIRFSFAMDKLPMHLHYTIIGMWWITLALSVLLIIHNTYANLNKASQSFLFSVGNALGVIDPIFWPIITLMVAQSVAVLIDYTRRPSSQQFFLKKTTWNILKLTIAEFGLLVALPFLVSFFI